MPKRDYKSYNILENELANSEPYPKDSIDLVQSIQKEKILDRENCYENENKVGEENSEKVEEKNAEEQIKEHAEDYTGEQIKEHAKDYTGEYTGKQIKGHTKEYIEEQIKEHTEAYIGELIKERPKDDIEETKKEYEKEKAKEDIIQQEVNTSKRLFLQKRNREERIKDKPFLGEKEQDGKKDNDTEKNLNLPAYKKYYQQKERSKMFKLIMGLARIICFIMLLPAIGIVGFGALIAVGSIALIIVGSIGMGVFILGTVCFVLSQLSVSLVALGITLSITLMAFGGIVLILVIMFIKWIKGLVRKNKRLQGKLVKEDR